MTTTDCPIYPNFLVKRESSILHDSSFDDDDVFSIKEVGDYPYLEVRAAVHNYDEDIPSNPIRSWTCGMVLVVVGASMNTLFSLRTPSIELGALIVQTNVWPLGHGWARLCQRVNIALEAVSESGPFQHQRAFYHRGHGQRELQRSLRDRHPSCSDCIL
jgi:hypothetical protein